MHTDTEGTINNFKRHFKYSKYDIFILNAQVQFYNKNVCLHLKNKM